MTHTVYRKIRNPDCSTGELFKYRPDKPHFLYRKSGLTDMGDELMRPVIASISPASGQAFRKPRDQRCWAKTEAAYCCGMTFDWKPSIWTYKD
jgi:hypothetical protein